MSIQLFLYDLQYTKDQFNKTPYDILQNALPECKHQKFNEILIMWTSSQLLNFLIIQSDQQLEHYVFADMISDLGVAGIVTRTVTRTIDPLLTIDIS